MKFKKALSIIICIALLITLMPLNNVLAWKVKTHNYSANLILEEVLSSGGRVTIPPFGQFNVAPEFYTALQKYPAAYRAGSLGPDAFPDIYVGQAYIHPAENKTSGEWLSLMLNDALALEQNSEKRYEIIAFILGFMTHYSGDLFGHTYINQIAHGAYPDMAELADPSKAENALSIITRHISSEGIIDKAIPQKYQNGEYIRIDAPNEFVLDSFIYDGTKDSGLSSKYKGIEAPVHIKYMVELRSFVKSKADYYRAYSNSKNIVDYAENTAICNYLDAWLKDIDRGINEWINVSESIARALIDNGTESDLTVAANEVRNWFDSYGKYMSPIPDVIIDVLGLPADIAKFFKEKLGIDVLQNLYDKFTAYIQDLIMNFMIYDVMGLTKEQIEEIKKAVAVPSIILGDKVVAKMTEDMSNFNQEVSALQQEFAPFYNTMTMVKLVLIGPDGYKQLINNSKSVSNTGYNYSIAEPKVDNLQVTIKTKGGISYYKGLFGIKYPYADQNGTDDDIYFGVKFRDGSTAEQLFDKSGYNDFEAGDLDTYTLPLNKSVKLGDIVQLYLKKVSTGLPGPNWKPEYFEVSAYNGNTKLKDLGRTNMDYFIEGSTTKGFDVGYSGLSYNTALNSGIIDFMQSLDNSMQWQQPGFILWSDTQLRTDIFYKIFKDVEKYDQPGFDPYVFNTAGYDNLGNGTNLTGSQDTDTDLTALADSINYVNASSWALNEMKNAVKNRIVKDFSIFEDCSANISRKDFAEIVVNLYEALIGEEAEAAPSNTFTDTSDIKILKAYKNGLVNGDGKGKFIPDASISREQMAVMFKNVISAAYNHIGKSYDEPEGSLSVGDKDKVSSWAKQSVHFVYTSSIITGDGTNFNPKGTAPVQQAVAVVNRVYEKYKSVFMSELLTH